MQQEDGEWVEPLKGYKMACCDCGLIHKFDFRIRKGKVQFSATRDNRATAQRRRRQNVQLKVSYT